MKILKLSVKGIAPATVRIKVTEHGRYFFVSHGESGRGRWEVRFPLASRLFPVPDYRGSEILDRKEADKLLPYLNLKEGYFSIDSTGRHAPCFETVGEFKLIPLGRKDSQNNDLFIIGRGHEDGTAMILWSLDPGYRGSATYAIEGQAELISKGYEAQGMAGRMGGASCPVVLVTGPSRLVWHREGRLYGSEADWVAEFDGSTWTAGPVQNCVLDEAALNW